MTRKYSRKLLSAINHKLPPALLEGMRCVGWNVFGIYELVKKEMADLNNYDCPKCKDTGKETQYDERNEAYNADCSECGWQKSRRTCIDCDSSNQVFVIVKTSYCGGYDDEKYKCEKCGRVWSVEGSDI